MDLDGIGEVDDRTSEKLFAEVFRACFAVGSLARIRASNKLRFIKK